jgi:hypothetical protein
MPNVLSSRQVWSVTQAFVMVCGSSIFRITIISEQTTAGQRRLGARIVVGNLPRLWIIRSKR